VQDKDRDSHSECLETKTVDESKAVEVSRPPRIEIRPKQFMNVEGPMTKPGDDPRKWDRRRQSYGDDDARHDVPLANGVRPRDRMSSTSIHSVH
jgi:hypothetical protein